MKQVIPFSKDIVFKTNIASITSISLEHEEKITDGEVSGDFVIFGDYKIHNDTTASELFKYRLPFTTLIPDNVDPASISIEVENFTYDTIDNDVLKVNIDFSIEGEAKETIEEPEEKRIEETSVKNEEIKNVFDARIVENNIEVNKPVINSAILSNIDTEKKETEEEKENNKKELEKKDEKINPVIEPIQNIEEIEPVKIIEEIENESVTEENREVDREIDNFIDNLIIPEPLTQINTQNNTIFENSENIEIKESTQKNITPHDTKENAIPEERPFPNVLPSTFNIDKLTNSLKKEETNKMDTSIINNSIEKHQEQTSEIKETKKESKEEVTIAEKKEEKEEYVTYHIHIIKEEETLDMIMNKYNTTMDIISAYNDTSNIKPKDKLIIPEYLDE